MSNSFAALWVFGFWMGYAFRHWGGKREKWHSQPEQPAPPADWLARLGQSLVEQFERVNGMHKFTGDDFEVTCVKPYGGGGKCYNVTVERDFAAERAEATTSQQTK